MIDHQRLIDLGEDDLRCGRLVASWKLLANHNAVSVLTIASWVLAQPVKLSRSICDRWSFCVGGIVLASIGEYLPIKNLG